MNFKNYSDLSNDIQNNFHKLCDEGYDLVVGLPRSGMIPAYMIALKLNVDCTDLNSFIDNRPLKKGYTRRATAVVDLPHQATNILVVDDSIFSGESFSRDMSLIPKGLREKITTLAIYSSKSHRNDVDVFFEYVPTPRVFEWNIFHASVLSRSCVDIDGVLCVDPDEDENDDGPRYIKFLINAKPLFLPEKEIHSLVTSRLEKYRGETETWLNKHKIEYKNLLMLDLPSKEHRLKLKMHAKFKAECYKNPEVNLFIESSARQAMEICQLTGKPVFCVANNLMYQPGMLSMITHRPAGFIKKALNFVRKELS